MDKIMGAMMRKILLLSAVGTCVTFMLSSAAFAGFELVCKGGRAQTNFQTVFVDCSNRKEFIDMLGSAWKTLRDNSIGGTMEDLCWEAYSQAKDMHPSISFENISDAFLARCNMGLAYAN
jgi:hypothetical protein